MPWIPTTTFLNLRNHLKFECSLLKPVNVIKPAIPGDSIIRDSPNSTELINDPTKDQGRWQSAQSSHHTGPDSLSKSPVYLPHNPVVDVSVSCVSREGDDHTHSCDDKRDEHLYLARFPTLSKGCFSGYRTATVSVGA